MAKKSRVVKINILILVFLTGIAFNQNNPIEQLPMTSIPANPNTVFYTGVLGTIYKSTTVNTSRAHSLLNFTFSNADYSRAAFDGVPEELKNFAYSTNLALVFQLLRTGSLFRQIGLTIGTQQGLTNSNPNADQLQWWYEGNFYSGVVFAFPHNLAGAISYLLATTPNTGDAAHELELAFSYTSNNILGQWGPSLEAAVPLGNSDGFLLQAGIDPSFTLFQKSRLPLSLSFPLRVGAGLLGYHVPDNDFTGYLSVGISSELKPGFIPDTYGQWQLFFEVDLLARDDGLANRNLPEDTGGNVVVTGRLGFRFLY